MFGTNSDIFLLILDQAIKPSGRDFPLAGIGLLAALGQFGHRVGTQFAVAGVLVQLVFACQDTFFVMRIDGSE